MPRHEKASPIYSFRQRVLQFWQHFLFFHGQDKCCSEIKPYSTSYVIFGVGAKCKIKGVGMQVCNGLPRIDDV